jgi:hypothetical protein
VSRRALGRHATCRRDETRAEDGFERRDFMDAADDARTARVAGDRREPDRILRGSALQSELAHVVGVQTREHGDRQNIGHGDRQFRGALGRGTNGGLQHGTPAQRMHRQHP